MHYIELYIFALNLYSNSLNHFIWKILLSPNFQGGEMPVLPPPPADAHARRLPWQAKCKKWAPLLACISVISILLIFSRFLFLAFGKVSRSVSGDFGCQCGRVQLIA